MRTEITIKALLVVPALLGTLALSPAPPPPSRPGKWWAGSRRFGGSIKMSRPGLPVRRRW